MFQVQFQWTPNRDCNCSLDIVKKIISRKAKKLVITAKSMTNLSRTEPDQCPVTHEAYFCVIFVYYPGNSAISILIYIWFLNKLNIDVIKEYFLCK